MKIRQLELEDAEFIAHTLAMQLMNSESEPIPPFHTRHAGKLESCLSEPFQTFDGKFLHRTFTERAAKLFYLITKNHCFENGNKRMAVTMTLVFFFTNKRWINIASEELYKIACEVAESDPKDSESVHKELIKIFKNHTVVHAIKLPRRPHKRSV